MRRTRASAAALVVAAVAVAAVPAAGDTATPGPAPDDAGPPGAVQQLTLRRSIDAETGYDGRVRQARMLTELQVRADEPVTVRYPIGASEPRSLTTLLGPTIDDGEAVWDLTPDGLARRRTVADYDGDLPVSAQLRLEVGGEEVAAGDLADRDGSGRTRLLVRNTTARTRTLTWDHRGETQTAETDVPVPMLARVTATFGDGWAGVQAPGGAVTTDADGTTTVRWVAVLFEPFGSLSQELEATGAVDGAQPPQVTVEATPIQVSDTQALTAAVELLRDGQSDAGVLAFALSEVHSGLEELAGGLEELASQPGAGGQGAGGQGTGASGVGGQGAGGPDAAEPSEQAQPDQQAQPDEQAEPGQSAAPATPDGGDAATAQQLGSLTRQAQQIAQRAQTLAQTTDLAATAGGDIAGSFARDLALLQAMDRRARRDGVPLGAPEGADASAAYRLTLAGEDDGLGIDPWWAGAFALLALGALGPGWLARRMR